MPYARVYIIAALVVFLGLGWWLSPSGSCSDRVESGVERAFSAAWFALLDEQAASGEALSASQLTRSQRGMLLLRRIETIARDSVRGAEWSEPSSSEARRWLRDFVELVKEAEKQGVAAEPLKLLELSWIEEDRLQVEARAGAQVFRLEIFVTCEGNRPVRLRPRSS